MSFVKKEFGFQFSRITKFTQASSLGFVLLIVFCGCEGDAPISTPPNNGPTKFTATKKPIKPPVARAAISKQQAKQMSDTEFIEAISKIGKNCNSNVFKNSKAKKAVLSYEWQKIAQDVSELYHTRFEQRPEPSGAFLRPSVFYSHNKHFEWIVAKALIGDSRQHVELQRTMMASPYFPTKLHQELLLGHMPNYAKLGQAIKKALEDNGAKKVTDHSSQQDESSRVTTSWKTIQTIDDVEYEMQMIHTVHEVSGMSIFPARYYKSDNSQIQFAVSMCIREKSKGGEGTSIGMMDCSIFVMDNQPFSIDTDLNNWAVFESGMLDSDELTHLESTFETKPDAKFLRKVACSWKEDSDYNSITKTHGIIESKLK